MSINHFISIFLITFICSNAYSSAISHINDELSLQNAINEANNNSNIKKIIFEKNAHIFLTAPVIYTGRQSISLIGQNAIIDGSNAGNFELDENLTASSTDGTLIFNTASRVTIRNISIVNSASRGLVINIPDDAKGDDLEINLNKVNVNNSALYGLHIDDNANEFDEGILGSEIGINLTIRNSNFLANGTGAIDFDGIRLDERASGNIDVVISHTHIDGNGGDGIELDEAGEGDVDVTMRHVTMNNNGFYNAQDLDDGFDIDEADDGSINAKLVNVQVKNNKDEGLDFDEAGEGNIAIKLNRVDVADNNDEGIKLDEADSGDIEGRFKSVQVIANGDDGVQFTELGDGQINFVLKKVVANDNEKYGIKMEQWFIEDEAVSVEEPGKILLKKVSLNNNDKGDDIKINNLIITSK